MNNLFLSIPTLIEPPSMLFYVFTIIAFIFSSLITLVMIIAGIYLIVVGIKEHSFKFDGVPLAIIAFVMCGATVFASGFSAMNYDNRKKEYAEWCATEYEEVAYDEIYSLKLQNETSGGFVLGCGRMDTDNYYYFYTKNEKGLYQFTKLKYKNDIFINETDETPKVIQRKDKDSDFIYYIINVPVGTVVDANYKVV